MTVRALVQLAPTKKRAANALLNSAPALRQLSLRSSASIFFLSFTVDTGTFARDSRGELLYYTTWGYLAGSACSLQALALHGVTSFAFRVAGVGLFIVGQLGNAWCHLELRRLRATRAALGSHTYVIPSRGPFNQIACPHYSFELLTVSQVLGACMHASVSE